MIMKAERQQKDATSRVIQPSKGVDGQIVDNRPYFFNQAKTVSKIRYQPIIQRLTNGQIARIENRDPQKNIGILNNRGKLGSYTAERLFQALTTFIKMNADMFTFAKDKALQTCLNEIIDHLEIAPPANWDEVVKSANVEGYKEIFGTYGKVPVDIVEEICTRWRISKATIQTAINKIAAPHGDNGVKILSGCKYTAELKIMRMGDDRVFSTSTSTPYLFDTVDAGLHK